MPTKKKGGPDCQLLAMNPDQLKNLLHLHYTRYKGEEEINCNGCLQAQEAVINGATGLVVATEGHDKSPATCLQAFWRVCCNSKTMNKNGSLGRKAELTVEDIAKAEKALSRASTAPGTPSYNLEDGDGDGEGNEDEEVPDTQDVGSSAAPTKPAPTAPPVEDGDEMVEDGDEMVEDGAAIKPKEKRGRGRPKGSKNSINPKTKARYKMLMKGVEFVPRDDLQMIAGYLTDGQIRFVPLEVYVHVMFMYGLSLR